jgi:hypothetical protein
LIALAVIAGCVKRPLAVDFEKEFLDEKAMYEPNIGRLIGYSASGHFVRH